MHPLVALAIVAASAAGLVLYRREAAVSRQALERLSAELGGRITGGLISYPILWFEVNGTPAWIGASTGGFGDSGAPGPSTLCRIDVVRPGRQRIVLSAADLVATTAAAQVFDGRRLRAVLDAKSVTVEVAGVCRHRQEYSAMVAIARELLDG